MKLIIGAGFIGSALAARFAGKEKIRVVSRSGSPLFSKHNIEYVKGNLKELEWDTGLKDVDMGYVTEHMVSSMI